jgi:hypothetical protein
VLHFTSELTADQFELPKPAKTALQLWSRRHRVFRPILKERALVGAAAGEREELMSKILPVIMCGGSGTRVWPESRESLPKHFIPLVGDRSTFQSIVSLLGNRTIFAPPVVITNFDYRFRVAEQLKDIGVEATILLEPERRDSAAAAARDPKPIVAVLAADHAFGDGKGSLNSARRPA